MPSRIYLIQLKLTKDKLDRITQFLERYKDDYELIDACYLADYIITELKSPSRILRNVNTCTCPVVHTEWLVQSFLLRKKLDPKPFIIDMSSARVPRPISKPFPRQVTWSQLAEMRKVASHTAKDEKLLFYSRVKRRNTTIDKSLTHLEKPQKRRKSLDNPISFERSCSASSLELNVM